jgi:hypothetical protein
VELPAIASSAKRQTILLALSFLALMAAVATLVFFEPSLVLLPLGAAGVLAGFRWVESAPSFTAVSGEQGRVLLHMHEGDLTLSRDSVRDVVAFSGHDDPEMSRRHQILIRKHDGGLITLAQLNTHHDEAEALRRRLEELLEKTPAGEGLDDTDAAWRRLRASDGVTVEEATGPEGYRDHTSEVSLSWSLHKPWRQVLAFPLISLGLACAILPFVIASGADPVGWVLPAFFAAFAMVAAALMAKDQASTMALRIDDRELSMTRRRRQRIVEKRKLPLLSVVAVALQAGSLTLRIEEAGEQLVELADRPPRPGVAMVRSILALARQTIDLRAQSLPLSLRLDLETVIGARIAEATGRSEKEL